MNTLAREAGWVIEQYPDKGQMRGRVVIVHTRCNFAHNHIKEVCWYCNESQVPERLLAQFNYILDLTEM